MLLSTQSVNVAMLMATYGVAGGFGMGLVYLESFSNLNPVIDQTAKKKLSLNTLDSCHEEGLQRFFLLKPSVCVVGYYFEKKRALATGYATLLSFSRKIYLTGPNLWTC